MKKLILLCILCFTLIIFAMFIFNNNPYEKRIVLTKTSLIYLRKGIEDYKQREGVFPESLLTMKQYFDSNGIVFNIRKEFISSVEGTDFQFEELSGEGGWYYNKDTGKLIINIDKPLKECFSNYYYRDRNQIPSDW